MSDWRLAEAIVRLREQVNKKYPGRRKDSDGTIGDASHASRSSDHNPWVRDGKMGVVTACDITHDPDGGCDAGVLANVLRASRDPRIKYIIWNRQICSSETSPWTWRKYTGSNPHNHHCHISVKSTKAFYDNKADWAMPGIAPVKPTAPPPPPEKPLLVMGSHGEPVKELQTLLKMNEKDGWFGKNTFDAVVAFQKKAKLDADGKVGSYTWAALAA